VKAIISTIYENFSIPKSLQTLEKSAEYSPRELRAGHEGNIVMANLRLWD
jgi:hypothetical protein